jgi:dTDP-4-amino-4,6-dideoxygalactose transaminase
MAISRYGARVIPDTQQTIAELRRRGQLIQGPHLAQFEEAFAHRLGVARAVTTSYGRMAFRYLLEALAPPPGAEIIVPALTFWVVPEMARTLGLTVVFADVDPQTATLDPEAVEALVTDRTWAIVPTHLYGAPCDMDRLLPLAARHGLKVIEDCAHALGATYRGRPVGTFGDGAFFSLQLLKPLNTYGGGVAVARDAAVMARVAELASSEPWPTEPEVLRRLLVGRAQRILIRPRVFTWTLFPILWTMSLVGADPDVYLWERIRPLDPLPAPYRRRYTNVQAAIGLKGLARLDEWTDRTIAHARTVDRALADLPGVLRPTAPPGGVHVYYQYSLRVPDRARVSRRLVRRGVDVETLHVDLCPRLPLFGARQAPTPGAEEAANAIQIPVYASLTSSEVERIARIVRTELLRCRRPPETSFRAA